MPKKTGILTNIIETIQVDNERLDKKYTVTEISCAGLDKDRRNARLKTLPTEIRRSGETMALVRSGATYYVLLKRGDSLDLSVDELAIKTTGLTTIPYYVRDKLLLGALPKLMLYPEGTQKKIFDGGDPWGAIYYPIEIKTRRGEELPYMVITVYVEIAPDFNIRDDEGNYLRYLRSGVQTFMHQEYLNTNSKSFKRGPKYRLDPDYYILTQDHTGDYIKRSLKHSRNRVDAINIKNESVGNYLKSRSGVLGLCLENINSVYGESLKIKFKRIPAENYTTYSQDAIKPIYDAIWIHMRSYTTTIINTTTHTNVLKILGDKLDDDHFNWSPSNNPINDHSNILIVPSKEECEKMGHDPYQDIKRKFPDAVIQACTCENILQGGNIQKHAYEVVIKELLVKHEVHLKKTLIPGPSVPENIQFIYPHPDQSNNDKQKSFHFYSLEFNNGKMCFQVLGEKEIENIVLDINKNHEVFIQGRKKGSDKKPFVYWPSTGDYIFFVETDAVALPEITEMMKHMKILEENREQSAARSILVDFIEEHPTTEVSNTIHSLLNDQLDADVFEYSHIQDSLRHNKTGRKDKKLFMDYIVKETGVKWTGSLRQKKDGYLKSNLGFFENRTEGVYYAGSVGPAKQTFATFCHLYRLVTNMDRVPDEIMALIEGVFYVRHKQNNSPSVSV